ncbi:unnamed protein product [Somion occarium]|uniref:Uncharacterized protein n=1 Tax=Somion occarium TaxID=3059160 RepID=A0ABP1DXF8_9APHY
MFRGIAELIHMDSPNRADFLEGWKPGGKYDGIVAIFRRNFSAAKIGIFNEELINGLSPSVKWIAQMAAGYDPVDVAACKKRGILVSRVPGAVNDATATTALFLIISTLRQFSKAERDLRDGLWKSRLSPSNAHDVTGRTLAILGLGGIGLRLAELAHTFSMRIVYHNRRKVMDVPDWCEFFEKDRLQEMLGMADVLSVHIPLSKDTERYVDEKMIRALKKGAIIVNTARGGVIDEDAMIRALEDGHLAGAGLDVFPREPNINPRLLDLPSVTLLPHMGAGTGDTKKKMEIVALKDILDFLTKGRGKNVVPEMRDWVPV